MGILQRKGVMKRVHTRTMTIYSEAMLNRKTTPNCPQNRSPIAFDIALCNILKILHYACCVSVCLMMSVGTPRRMVRRSCQWDDPIGMVCLPSSDQEPLSNTPLFEEWLVHNRRRRLAESREEDELTLLAMADADRAQVIHRARNVWKVAFGFLRLSTKRRIDTGVKRAKALPTCPW
jgi:hypothetical protein